MTLSTTIGELQDQGAIRVGDGYRTKRSEHGKPGYRILRVGDIKSGQIIAEGDDFVGSKYIDAIGEKLSRPGDVLLTTKGTVGRVAIVPPDLEQMVYSPQLCYFRVKHGDVIDARYLSYWFQSSEFRRQALHRANNTDMAPYINLRDIRSLRLTLPTLPTQRAIAEVLGTLDDKIAANNDTASIAADLAAALFQSAVEAPATTVRSSIRALSTEGMLTYGDGYRTKRAEHGQPGMQIVRAGDIRDGRLIPGGDDFVRSDYSDKVGPKTCHPGDIVLTTKGTVGRVATVQDGISLSVYSPQLCYFRVAEDHGWLQPWLAEWFRSADRIRQTDIAMHKSDMAPYVNLHDIGSLQVPIPATGSQEPVIEQLRSLQRLGHVIARENEVLADTRDELLPLLMSGKLRVKDAEKKVEAIAQ
ncbi:restriction endonuclease subunit S [Nocardia nova]|uniref:restriction endonuclease subunit S n=1 Tax=Nocardia nova TaxID=37330 RepID=UPI000AF598A8|nr:restriction endonuclease subunit S [Nocardia nova]